MDRIKSGMLVTRHGMKGVTVDDMAGCCSPEQTPVVYDGETSFEGVLTEELHIIGPENPVADLVKCGAGSSKCCIFLTAGPQGMCCERHSDLRYTLIFKTMAAKRHPKKLFPACQDLEDGNPE